VSQPQDSRNPRAKALWEKWRHVWMMAWERDRRLKDKLNYLEELEKVKNFNWDDWRKRFLKHHNNKKSRVTDLFRKLDEDGDGYLTRDDFMDGVLKAKFPSSRLEMNAVADMFDHGDGMIDWREFIAALRPDWQDRGPLTDVERIDDEINRQVALCTCRQKFKVFQVGEGKYRVRSLFTFQLQNRLVKPAIVNFITVRRITKTSPGPYPPVHCHGPCGRRLVRFGRVLGQERSMPR
jgi:dystonin